MRPALTARELSVWRTFLRAHASITRQMEHELAEKQLEQIAFDLRAITLQMTSKLTKLQAKAGDSKWATIRRAVESVFAASDLQKLEDKLEKVQGQMNTALLVRLQYVQIDSIRLDSIDHAVANGQLRRTRAIEVVTAPLSCCN